MTLEIMRTFLPQIIKLVTVCDTNNLRVRTNKSPVFGIYNALRYSSDDFTKNIRSIIGPAVL